MRWLVRLGVAGAILHFPFSIPAGAQNVVDVLIEQRRDARVAEIMAEIGDRVPPRGQRVGPPTDLVLQSYYAIRARERAVRDSIRRANDVAADSVILAARLASARWRKVESGEQGAFLDRYRETYWQAVRDGRGGTLDTTSTPVLRARLQAAFGRPTRNADAQRRYGYGGSEFVQFEYWFVVNDSIPILALDIDGPFGRGLLVAGAEEQAAYHVPLKATLAARLGGARLDPYVDYYRSFERERWYRTGYNGAEFYTLPVRRPPRWSGQAESDRWIIHR
ncbi:MAG: hypothetical protein AAF845_06245 [Bacteroidota bacterium]